MNWNPLERISQYQPICIATADLQVNFFLSAFFRHSAIPCGENVRKIFQIMFFFLNISRDSCFQESLEMLEILE